MTFEFLMGCDQIVGTGRLGRIYTQILREKSNDFVIRLGVREILDGVVDVNGAHRVLNSELRKITTAIQNPHVLMYDTLQIHISPVNIVRKNATFLALSATTVNIAKQFSTYATCILVVTFHDFAVSRLIQEFGCFHTSLVPTYITAIVSGLDCLHKVGVQRRTNLLVCLTLVIRGYSLVITTAG